MKRIIYLACFLAAISAIAGGILAFVNDMTYERINEMAIASEKENLVKIYPSGAFEEVTFSEDSGLIEKVFKVDNGAYIYKISVYGYKDYVSYLVAIKDDTIDGFAVISVNDTPGYGMRIDEPEYADLLKGTAVNEDVPLISGVTITTGNVAKGITAAFTLNDSLGGN
ncbi:MAG: FMN-binding protein [Erysipelotrichaceae bacterium]|nr:FMN-binding protein [Erysipelotrichaceae bacterium]MDD4642241.1 FMN-binding protein [Erysipelotrichaceae bacterium]